MEVQLGWLMLQLYSREQLNSACPAQHPRWGGGSAQGGTTWGVRDVPPTQPQAFPAPWVPATWGRVSPGPGEGVWLAHTPWHPAGCPRSPAAPRWGDGGSRPPQGRPPRAGPAAGQCTAQHGTAQHNTAQHDTARWRAITLAAWARVSGGPR